MGTPKAPHILSTSSNLLGFSFIVLTSIKGFGFSGASYVDEIVALSIVCFSLACLFSFMSIRTSNEERSQYFEKIADYIFLSGLTVISCTAILLVLDIVSFTK